MLTLISKTSHSRYINPVCSFFIAFLAFLLFGLSFKVTSQTVTTLTSSSSGNKTESMFQYYGKDSQIYPQEVESILIEKSKVAQSGVEATSIIANEDKNLGSLLFKVNINNTIPLTVLTFSPANNETNVATGANLVLTFNQDVKKGVGNIRIKKVSDNSVVELIDVTGSQVSISGAVVTIDPASNLAEFVEVYVEIEANTISDLADVSYAGISNATTWKFTTLGVTPIISSKPTGYPNTSIAENKNFNYAIAASDPNGDELTFSMLSGPTWLSLSTSVASAVTKGSLPSATYQGVVSDHEGNIYVALQNGTTIYKITPDGTTSVWKTGRPIGSIYNMAFHDGHLYVLNYGNNYISRIDVNDPLLIETTILTGYSSPYGAAFKDGYMYVSSSNLDKVIRVAISSMPAIYNTGTMDYITSGLSIPDGLDFDSSGNLYIANKGYSKISKYDGVTLTDYISGIGANNDVKFDRSGNLYVALQGVSGSIVKYAAGTTTSPVTVPAGTGIIWAMNINPAGTLVFVQGNETYNYETGAVLTGTPIHTDVGGPYSVTIRVDDANGHTTDQNFNITVTDPNPPTVNTYSPAHNSTGISKSSNLSLSFNEAVQKGTGNITIHCFSDDSTIETISVGDASVSVDGSTVTIDPNSDLPYLSEIYIKIDAGAFKDVNNNNYAGINANNIWRFTTVVAPPKLISIERNSSNPTKSTSVEYKLTFSASVTGISASNFQLTTLGGVTGASITAITGNENSYTVTVNTGSGSGTIGLNLIDASGISPTLDNTIPFTGALYTIDRMAPTAPIGLVLTAGNGQVKFDWNANSEPDIASYNVYGGTTSPASTLISTITGGVTSYTHLGLTNGTTYVYRITALDNLGNESEVSEELTATPKALQTISFGSLGEATYGDTDVTLNATASSNLPVTYSSSNEAVATILAGKIRVVGPGTAVITASQSGNNEFVAASDQLQEITVKKKILTLTLNDLPTITKVYDGSTSATLVTENYTLNGLVGSDAVSVEGIAVFDGKDVGTNKAVTASTFMLKGAHKDNYVLSTSSATSTGSITAKAITVTLNAVPTITKVYDGSTSATLVPENYTLNGIVGSDAVSVEGIAVFDGKDVGTNKAVTASTFMLKGAHKDNYVLSTSSATSTGSITAKAITVTLNAVPTITKVYDGSTSATLVPENYTFNGIVGSDAVSVEGIAVFDGKDVGTNKAVTASTFMLKGAHKDNYVLSTSSATSTGSITAKAIIVTLNAVPTITKVYDGSTSATLVPENYTFNGIVGSDAVSVEGIAVFDGKDVGTNKAVTASTFMLKGAHKDNYVLSTSSATSTGSITAKAITVTLNAVPTITKVYDGSTSATLVPENYTLNGIVGSDAVSVEGIADFDGKDVGTNKAVTASTFMLKGAQKDNYSLSTISAATTGIISKKALTVVADNKTRLQGTVNPGFSVRYSGFISGENVSQLIDPPLATTSAIISSVAGNYSITVSGGSAVNYSFNYQPGILTITPGGIKDISLSTVTLYENQESNTLVGAFHSTSDDVNATYSYSLVDGDGSADNSHFVITGNELRTNSKLDFEKKSAYSIRISSTTQQGLTLEKQFTIHVQDINEAPTLATIINQNFCYTSAVQRINLTGISAGPETSQKVTISTSSTNPSLFNQLEVIGNVLNYRIKEGQSGSAKISVTVKDNGGTEMGGIDTYSVSFNLNVNLLPQVSITTNSGLFEVSKGETLVLSAVGGSNYTWANSAGIISGNGSSNLIIRPTETTTYKLTVSNTAGCSVQEEITIKVNEDYKAIRGNNILSPNGDGINDRLVIKNIEMYPNNELKIYDVTGRLIFSQKNYNNQWDASLNGLPLANGTYYYTIDFGPGKVKLKEFITIVKD